MESWEAIKWIIEYRNLLGFKNLIIGLEVKRKLSKYLVYIEVI